jgi:hypothetical protein
MVKLNNSEATMLLGQVKSHCIALNNWIATAVESDDIGRAKELIKELREYQALYSKLNGAIKYGD